MVAGIAAPLLTGACAPEEGRALRLIRGGVDSLEHSAVVAVVVDGQVRCSGTLIDERVVLTAAHCLDDRPVSVFYGRDPSRPDDVVGVVEQRVAPGFGGSARINDVALLRLERSVDGTPPLAVASAAETAPDLGERVTVVGFGYTGPEAEGELRRRAGSSEIVAVDEVYFATAPGPSQACHGDSGGPGLVEFGGAAVVVGVTSTTEPDCQGRSNLVRVDRFWTDFVEPFLTEVAESDDASLTCGLGARGGSRSGSGALVVLLAVALAGARRVASS